MKVTISGVKEIKEFIQSIPRGVKLAAMEAVAWYMVGDPSHGFKWYPKKTTQKYVRTYTLRQGWYFTESNSDWRTVQIRNEVAYAPYVPPRWSRYGWREWVKVAADNMKGALRHAQAAVSEFLQRKGK